MVYIQDVQAGALEEAHEKGDGGSSIEKGEPAELTVPA